MLTTYKLDDFLQRKYKKILIFGIAGAGKTTLGRKLSEISGIEFNDFDDFFYQNSELKIQNYSEYIAKRKKEEQRNEKEKTRNDIHPFSCQNPD